MLDMTGPIREGVCAGRTGAGVSAPVLKRGLFTGILLIGVGLGYSAHCVVRRRILTTIRTSRVWCYRIVPIRLIRLAVGSMTSRARATAPTATVTSLVWCYLHVVSGLWLVLPIQFIQTVLIIF